MGIIKRHQHVTWPFFKIDNQHGHTPSRPPSTAHLGCTRKVGVFWTCLSLSIPHSGPLVSITPPAPLALSLSLPLQPPINHTSLSCPMSIPNLYLLLALPTTSIPIWITVNSHLRLSQYTYSKYTVCDRTDRQRQTEIEREKDRVYVCRRK